MRKIAAVVLFLFALGLGLDTGNAQASGVVTFNFTNNARYTIFLKFFSQNRTWVWPSATSNYVLNDNKEHSIRLTCNIGEKICYGAGYSHDGTGSSWGVGFLGKLGCSGCCLTCAANNPTHGWNLDD